MSIVLLLPCLCALQIILYIMALQDDSGSDDGDGGQAAAAQDSPATDEDGSNAGSEALEDGGSGTGVDLGANDDTAAQDDAPDAGEAQQPQVSGRRFGRPTSPLCLILVSFLYLSATVQTLLRDRHPCCVALPNDATMHPLEDHLVRGKTTGKTTLLSRQPLLHVQPAAVEAAAAAAEAVAAADSVPEGAVAADPVHDDFGADNAAAVSKLQPVSAAERSAARQRRQTKTQPSSLLAIVTANVWNKTELLLQSLTANRDAFEVLVIC